MLAAATISLFLGAILAQHAKVFILIPVILLTLLIAIGTAIGDRYTLWTIAVTAVVISAGLQIGYLFGIAVRYLRVLARASRMRSRSLTRSRLVY